MMWSKWKPLRSKTTGEEGDGIIIFKQRIVISQFTLRGPSPPMTPNAERK